MWESGIKMDGEEEQEVWEKRRKMDGEEEQEIMKWERRWNVNTNFDEIKFDNNLS